MQTDQGVGIGIAAATALVGTQGAHREARGERDREEYPDENEGIYHQIADVVAKRGNVLGDGHLGLVADLEQQALGQTGVGPGRQNRGDEGAGSLNLEAGFLKFGELLHGDLGGRVVENGQDEIALGAVENCRLRLGAQLECGGGRWNSRQERL